MTIDTNPEEAPDVFLGSEKVTTDKEGDIWLTDTHGNNRELKVARKDGWVTHIDGKEVKYIKQAGKWIPTHIGEDEIFRDKKTGEITSIGGSGKWSDKLHRITGGDFPVLD